MITPYIRPTESYAIENGSKNSPSKKGALLAEQLAIL
jgi:hypothetical protein